MIYLRNTTDPQTVLIPMEAWNAITLWETISRSGENRFKAMFDNKDIEVEEGPGDEEGVSEFGHYARLVLRLPEGLADGSYEMTVEMTEPASLVGKQTFVVQVGDYNPEVVEYDKTIVYEQY